MFWRTLLEKHLRLIYKWRNSICFLTKLDDFKWGLYVFILICVRNVTINTSPLPYPYSEIVAWGSFPLFDRLHLKSCLMITSKNIICFRQEERRQRCHWSGKLVVQISVFHTTTWETFSQESCVHLHLPKLTFGHRSQSNLS